MSQTLVKLYQHCLLLPNLSGKPCNCGRWWILLLPLLLPTFQKEKSRLAEAWQIVQTATCNTVMYYFKVVSENIYRPCWFRYNTVSQRQFFKILNRVMCSHVYENLKEYVCLWLHFPTGRKATQTLYLLWLLAGATGGRVRGDAGRGASAE